MKNIVNSFPPYENVNRVRGDPGRAETLNPMQSKFSLCVQDAKSDSIYVFSQSILRALCDTTNLFSNSCFWLKKSLYDINITSDACKGRRNRESSKPSSKGRDGIEFIYMCSARHRSVAVVEDSVKTLKSVLVFHTNKSKYKESTNFKYI